MNRTVAAMVCGHSSEHPSDRLATVGLDAGFGVKARALDAIRRLDGLNELHNFVGPNYTRDMPTVQRKLSCLDWRILRALRGDAVKSLVLVAKELGVGYRSVKRHFDRMAAEGSFFRVPVLDLSQAPGVIPCVLVLRVGSDAVEGTVSRVLRAFDDRMAFWYVPSSLSLGHIAVMAFPPALRAFELVTYAIARPATGPPPD